MLSRNRNEALAGVLVGIACLLPNLINVFFPPTQHVVDTSDENLVLTAAEWITRIIVIFYPAIRGVRLYRDTDRTKAVKAFVFNMVASLIITTVIWIFYVIDGRDYAFLFYPFGGFFIPLVFLPSFYYLNLGLYMKSKLMTSAAVIFMLCHNIISYHTWLKIAGVLT